MILDIWLRLVCLVRVHKWNPCFIAIGRSSFIECKNCGNWNKV